MTYLLSAEQLPLLLQLPIKNRRHNLQLRFHISNDSAAANGLLTLPHPHSHHKNLQHHHLNMSSTRKAIALVSWHQTRPADLLIDNSMGLHTIRQYRHPYDLRASVLDLDTFSLFPAFSINQWTETDWTRQPILHLISAGMAHIQTTLTSER